MTALRSWRKSPRLTAALLACTVVSIAGTATVLTFVHGVLIRPLPFPDAGRLVSVVPANLADSDRAYLSYPNFVDLRSSARSFALLEGVTVSRLVVQTSRGNERLRGETVTPGYFDLLGARPALGRTFTAAEYAGSGPRTILLSHRLWQGGFAGDPAILGQPVSTRIGPAVVVGVLPASYPGVGEEEGTDYWLAEKQNNHPDMMTDRSLISTMVIGRLCPGVALAQADAELQGIVRGLVAAHPDANVRLSAHLEPLAEHWRGSLRAGLLTMLVGSVFLLLIGCGNVALLLLTRLMERERELALRLSLGATRSALVRMLLGESLLLAAVGGGLGVLLASWLVDLFHALAGPKLPAHLPVALTGAPIALCALVVLVTGVAFGVLPAFAAARVNAATALHAAGRALATSALQARSGRALIVAQTALAIALLSGAALFLRSYERLRHAEFGYRTESLLRYQVSLARDGYRTPEAVENFYRQLATDLTALPGVRKIGYMGPTVPPYDGLESSLRLKGGDLPTPDGRLSLGARYADRNALEILTTQLRAGRMFGPGDRRGSPVVGLASETLARQIAPHGSATGRVVVLEQLNTEVEIIGIVGDALWEGRRNRHPTHRDLLLSIDQFPQLSTGILLATAVEPRLLIDPVRKAILARDGSATLHWITTMEQALDDQTATERLWTNLSIAYGATSFLLAVIGLYGALSHSVASRERELGVRLALGASAGALTRLVLGQGLRLVLMGLAIGLAAALGLGRLLQARLFDTSAHDPIALGASAAALVIVAALACLVPARRAARTDPMGALRAE